MTDVRAAAFPPRALLVLDVPSLAAFRSVDAPSRARVLGWDDLICAAQVASPSTIVLLDPGDAGGAEPDPRVRTLIGTAPMLPVVAMLPFGDAEAIRLLMEWGVGEVADASFEGSPAGIAPLLRRVHAAPFKRRIEAALPPFLSLNALTLVRAAAATTVDHNGAAELAEMFGCGERTVAGWCAREGLPAPRRLMAWLRALLGVALLEEPHRSVLNASQCAGYASDHPLRRSLRELLPGHESRSPRAIRFDELMTVLNDELRSLREVSRKLRLRQHTA